MKKNRFTLVAAFALSGTILFSSCVGHLVCSTAFLLGTSQLEISSLMNLYSWQ